MYQIVKIPRKTLLQLPMLHRCAFFDLRCSAQNRLEPASPARDPRGLFWLFFEKILHNSKSIGPFDLILILLGALAHFSQDRLF